MRMKIELIIDTAATWQEVCGGKIKSILHHHFNNLRKDLKIHIGAGMVDTWYTSDDSNCKVCTYHIDNDAGYHDNGKRIDTAINGCALRPDMINGEDLRHFWTKGTSCPYYCAAEAHRQNLTFEELKAFQQTLKLQNGPGKSKVKTRIFLKQ